MDVGRWLSWHPRLGTRHSALGTRLRGERQSRIPLRCIRATVHAVAVAVTVAGGKGIAAEAAPTVL